MLWILSIALVFESKFHMTLNCNQLLHQSCQNSIMQCFQKFQSVHGIIKVFHCTTHLFHIDIKFNQLSLLCTVLCDVYFNLSRSFFQISNVFVIFLNLEVQLCYFRQEYFKFSLQGGHGVV